MFILKVRKMKLNRKLKNSILVEFPMKFPETEKPKLEDFNGLTSKPVFAFVDGQLYRGHFHSNGWFYGSVDGSNMGDRIMAVYKPDYVRPNSGIFQRPSHPSDFKEPLHVSSYCYCDELLIHQ